jgi:hypothetical protein
MPKEDAEVVDVLLVKVLKVTLDVLDGWRSGSEGRRPSITAVLSIAELV